MEDTDDKGNYKIGNYQTVEVQGPLGSQGDNPSTIEGFLEELTCRMSGLSEGSVQGVKCWRQGGPTLLWLGRGREGASSSGS